MERSKSKLCRHHQFDRFSRKAVSAFYAPAGLSVADSLQYLADKVIDKAMAISHTLPRRERQVARLRGNLIEQGDALVRYCCFPKHGGDVAKMYHCTARRGSHWFPLAVGFRTCEQSREQLAFMQAFTEAHEQMPINPDHIVFTPIEGSRFGTMTFGTEEEEAQRHEIIERRSAEILETAPKLLPGVHVQWHDWTRNARLSRISMTFCLDIDEDAINDKLVRQAAEALGASGRIIDVDLVSRGLSAFAHGRQFDEPPPVCDSWREYFWFLYRHGRFDMLDADDLKNLLQR